MANEKRQVTRQKTWSEKGKEWSEKNKILWNANRRNKIIWMPLMHKKRTQVILPITSNRCLSLTVLGWKEYSGILKWVYLPLSYVNYSMVDVEPFLYSMNEEMFPFVPTTLRYEPYSKMCPVASLYTSVVRLSESMDIIDTWYGCGNSWVVES